MPTYGYRCSKCANEFDVVERMADKPNGRCPLCGGRGTRLFFPVGIVFKGTGFYKTDSRGDSRASASEAPPAPAPAGSDAAAPAPAGEEAKVATKTETGPTPTPAPSPPGAGSKNPGDAVKKPRAKAS